MPYAALVAKATPMAAIPIVLDANEKEAAIETEIASNCNAVFMKTIRKSILLFRSANKFPSPPVANSNVTIAITAALTNGE